MFERHLAPELLASAAKMPVVTLTGPRQSGRTTLVRTVFPEMDYVSLERPDERSRASRKRIADTLLVAALIEHGVKELVTVNVRDFGVFDEIFCSSPLASAD